MRRQARRGRRPFRRFKDALHEFPQVREAWHRDHDEKLKEAAREWVRFSGIDAELVEINPPAPGPS